MEQVVSESVKEQIVSGSVKEELTAFLHTPAGLFAGTLILTVVSIVLYHILTKYIVVPSHGSTAKKSRRPKTKEETATPTRSSARLRAKRQSTGIDRFSPGGQLVPSSALSRRRSRG